MTKVAALLEPLCSGGCLRNPCLMYSRKARSVLRLRILVETKQPVFVNCFEEGTRDETQDRNTESYPRLSKSFAGRI